MHSVWEDYRTKCKKALLFRATQPIELLQLDVYYPYAEQKPSDTADFGPVSTVLVPPGLFEFRLSSFLIVSTRAR